jgi:hypothetical protein
MTGRRAALPFLIPCCRARGTRTLAHPGSSVTVVAHPNASLAGTRLQAKVSDDDSAAEPDPMAAAFLDLRHGRHHVLGPRQHLGAYERKRTGSIPIRSLESVLRGYIVGRLDGSGYISKWLDGSSLVTFKMSRYAACLQIFPVVDYFPGLEASWFGFGSSWKIRAAQGLVPRD